MAHRLSRGDKGKWISQDPRPVRRPPVRIPDSNNNALIEEHKLTLIGRVTNPAIQKTGALVDFFLQHWHVQGRLSGKVLGPNLFQFKFETEQDLQHILSKAPFHFKRWMLILQRWEPIISDNFPALIPFWITIHGIPLHYWTEEALRAIGKELGPVEDFDVEKGRVRVMINGLKPLETKLDISMAGEIKQVELEFEKLEKHCFYCLSLTHEVDDCPTAKAKGISRGNRETPKGISQNRTLERLEADRKRKDERKGYRTQLQAPGRVSETSQEWKKDECRGGTWRCASNSNYDYGVRREAQRHENAYPPLSRNHGSRPSARERLSFSRESDVGSGRGNFSKSVASIPRNEWRPVSGGQRSTTPAKTTPSLVSHTPPPCPQREAISNPAFSSGARQRSGEGSLLSQERRPALERLSLPSERVPLLQDGVANSASGRLQEVEIQYLEDTLTNHPSGGSNKASTSKHQGTPLAMHQGGSLDRSPIRTLSEDRIHVSLRLGPMVDSPLAREDLAQEIFKEPSGDLPVMGAPTGKGKASKPLETKKRTLRSSVQVASVKKRRVTKTQNSPRRKPTTSGAPKGRHGTDSGTGQPRHGIYESLHGSTRRMAFGISNSRGTPYRGEALDIRISFSLVWTE
ncbi:hypothetical protein BRARA_G01598 [Brassica rapa]|uniref:DUF4283 domain-containing protein n=1 Tax=Brassica campestris TaxID=3711 RepID=A0A397YQP4_BRACM|nr:hypothetical protein BRARA_G01598 [Brassica rapa]